MTEPSRDRWRPITFDTQQKALMVRLGDKFMTDEQVEVRSGGVMGGRSLDLMDLFEATVEVAFGDLVRADKAVAVELWCALANVSWRHESAPGGLLYTFRGAGDLVAALRGDGDYIDWYCCGREGTVSKRVAFGLAGEGWTHEVAAG